MSAENYVTLGEVPEDEAKQYLSGADQMNLEDLQSAIPKFDPYHGKYFSAEHAVIGADLVYHFYLPQGVVESAGERVEHYWRVRFASALDSQAQSYFQAGAPRLQAKYTEEMGSWWLRARGYADAVDPNGLALGLYRALEEQLQLDS